MTEARDQPDGWERHRLDQLARVSMATPLERLRWLEDAIDFAYRAGALPVRTDQYRSDDERG